MRQRPLLRRQFQFQFFFQFSDTQLEWVQTSRAVKVANKIIIHAEVLSEMFDLRTLEPAAAKKSFE